MGFNIKIITYFSVNWIIVSEMITCYSMQKNFFEEYNDLYSFIALSTKRMSCRGGFFWYNRIIPRHKCDIFIRFILREGNSYGSANRTEHG